MAEPALDIRDLRFAHRGGGFALHVPAYRLAAGEQALLARTKPVGRHGEREAAAPVGEAQGADGEGGFCAGRGSGGRAT
ncbi:MAG: hypothetical protein ACKOGJ_03870, partial [Phycisphaerales bacterium]